MLDSSRIPQIRHLIIKTFTEVVQSRRPLNAVRDLFLDGRTRRYEALSLPLSDDGERINMLLVATEYLA